MTNHERAKLNLILSTLAFVVSAAGSVLLHIVFATTIYRDTGSALLTSLFISLQWMPLLVVLYFKSDWEDGVDPRKRWLALELIAAALTCPILLFLDEPNYVMLFVLLFLRGIVDQISRIVKTVSARYIFPPEKSAQYASIMQAGYHWGIGLAAVVSIGAGQYFTVRTAALLDIASFLVATSLLFFVRTINPTAVASKPPKAPFLARIAAYGQILMSDKRLLFCVLLPPASATFFQATYSVFQPSFPLKVLQLGADAVAVSYVLASIAIVGGSTFFAYLNKKLEFYKGDFGRTKQIIFGLSLASAVAYLGAAMSTDALMAAICFTIMIFTFEMVWMFGYAGIVAYAPKGELGTVVSITFGFGCCAASLCSIVAGSLIDALNGDFLVATAIFMTAFFTVLGVGHLVYVRSKGVAAPAQGRTDLAA